MITPAEQRFRSLFHSLDAENCWEALLTPPQLRYARTAAESADTWLSFLSGARAGDGLSEAEVWRTSSIVRKRVTFAAIDEDYFPEPCDDREEDQGLMSGSDAYTEYGELLAEELALRRTHTGAFRLLGYQGEAEQPKPLFGGRVRALLKDIEGVCKGMAEVAERERRGGYDGVEECLAAAEAALRAAGEELRQPRKEVEGMLEELRREYEEFVKWREETVRANRSTRGVLGVELGSADAGERLGFDAESVAYRGTGRAAGACAPKRPRVAVFGGAGKRGGGDKSLWEMLGPGNAVVKNLGLYERVMKLKKEMYRLQDAREGRVVKEEDEEVVEAADRPVLEIGEEREEGGVTRERRMGESFVGLLLSHTGFTHADERALGCLTDVFEVFVRDTGRELIWCRENVDNNCASVAERGGGVRRKSREELLMELEMIMNCVRGGFAELYNYVRADMMRTEQALREVEIRLKDRVRRLGGGGARADAAEEVDGAEFVREADVDAGGEAFAFGYLAKTVWVDVLGGIRVPAEMVYGSVKDEATLMPIDT